MQIVNFETTKLAKMKGYNNPARSWYNLAGLFILGCEGVFYKASNSKNFPSYLAPYQYELMD